MAPESTYKIPKESEALEGGYKQCPHGMCLDHNPEWIPTTNVLLMEVPFACRLHQVWYSASNDLPFTVNCCGDTMRRFVEVSEKSCKKCERVGYDVRRYILRCMCCGYTKTATEGSDCRFRAIVTDSSLMAVLAPYNIPKSGPSEEETKKKKKWWNFWS